MIALPKSEDFNIVFPELSDIVKVISAQDVEKLADKSLSSIYRKVYHTNGFINIQFQKHMTRELISSLNSYGIFHMSFDCGPSCVDVCPNPKGNNCYLPNNSSRTLGPEDIISIAKERISFIKSHFRGTIALENLDYHRGGAYEYVCEPDFISEILRKIDVYLAIDIGHALVTSFNLGFDPMEYISKLPLELVHEIHLSHSEAGNDRHDCPTSQEYQLLRYVLANSSPEFIIIEYYKDTRRIIEENIKLYEFLKNKEMS
jgi:hypothetical protein